MKKFIVLLLSVLTIMLLVYCQQREIPKETNVTIKLEEPYFFLSDVPSDSLLLVALKYYNMQEPIIVLAQAKLETGDYKSYQCLVNNNLFGLFNSKTGNYFKFNHWTESIEAYKKYIEYKRRPNENYYDFLNRIGYAEDTAYVNKLKFIINNW